jgi:hypothetical protein
VPTPDHLHQHARQLCLPSSLARCCSNRSAALLKLNKVAKALADAEDCVKLDPAFHKGYMRMALALESQQRLEEVGTLDSCNCFASICLCFMLCM